MEMKEILEMVNELTDRDLKEKDKMEFSQSAKEMISKADRGIVLMTDNGVASLGRGIDILPTIGLCLSHLIKDRLPEKEVWEQLFKDIIKEAFKDEEDDEDEDDDDEEVKVSGLLLKEEDFNKLSDREKLEHLDKVLDVLKKINK